MNRKIFQKTELYFFLIFSLISILPFFFIKYVPSLDGPQHLYNARMIAELIKGDEFISQYFRFNPVIVGNLTSLYAMAFLMLIFPAWLAEKIFLSFYIIGLALSFRYFIRSFQRDGSLLYLIIFPFAFTSLFLMGYYNFSVAFIPFFIALGIIRRNENRLGLREVIWLSILTLLIFLSHAIVFVFFGLIVMLQMIFDTGYSMVNSMNAWKGFLKIIKRYALILASAIPGIVLWAKYYLFLSNGGGGSSDLSIRPWTEILGELYKLRILIGFHMTKESGPNLILLLCMILFILLALVPWQKYLPVKFVAVPKNNPDWMKWSFITVFLFFLALFFPDRMVTGSMSLRLSILFFFSVIIWINLQSYPKKIALVGLTVILVAFSWHRAVIYDFHERLNREIGNIEDAGEFIEPHTIIFPVNCSDNWTQLHFHLYLGIDMPVVNIRNPQPNGPMPLLWNQQEMPNVLLGNLDQKNSGIQWVYGNPHLNPVAADYFFIWKSQRIQSVEGLAPLVDKISLSYTQLFKSKNNNALLYRLNQEN